MYRKRKREIKKLELKCLTDDVTKFRNQCEEALRENKLLEERNEQLLRNINCLKTSAENVSGVREEMLHSEIRCLKVTANQLCDKLMKSKSEAAYVETQNKELQNKIHNLKTIGRQ